jgi:hypothetical protein
MNILVIDMCWDFASDVGPTVNAPANATMVNALAEASLAEPQYGGQGEFMSPSIVYPMDLYSSIHILVFEMFWDIESDAGPSANAPADASMANPNNSFQGKS